MPISKVETTIDGHSVTITQFGGNRGYKLKIRLYKIVLPVVSSVFDVKDLKDLKQNILDRNINVGAAFSALAAQLDPDQTFTLLLDLLGQTFVDGQMIDQKKFDDLFAANYNLAYKLAWEVIKANNFFDFGDILSQLSASLTQISPKS